MDVSESQEIPASVQNAIQVQSLINLQYQKQATLGKQHQLQAAREDQTRHIRTGRHKFRRNASEYRHVIQSRYSSQIQQRYQTAPVEPRIVNGLAKMMLADTLGLRFNGEVATSVIVGEGGMLTFEFPTGETEAVLRVVFDLNYNGVPDIDDIYIEDFEAWLYDNDPMDMDGTDSLYALEYDPEVWEGLPNVQGGFFFEVESGDVIETVFVEQLPYETDLTVSGTVTDESETPLLGIAVIAEMYNTGEGAEYFIIDFTDSSGVYELALPQVGTWNIMSFDALWLAGGLFPNNSYMDWYVDLPVTDMDFVYLSGSALIEGQVLNQFNVPVGGVGVYAESYWGEQSLYTTTDDQGNFSFSVLPGDYWIGMDSETLFPAYMAPEDQDVYVDDEASAWVDFTVYSANSTITGTVTQNGNPAPGVGVSAWHWDFGWTQTMTGADGKYTLNVYDGPNPDDYYYVEVDHWGLPDYIFIQPYGYHDVLPNSQQINFTLISVSGGISGTVVNTQDPTDTLYFAWIDLWNTKSGEWYYTGVDWKTGLYEIYLPPGDYEVYVGAEGFFDFGPDFVTVGETLIEHKDYALDPYTIVGSFSGKVTDAGNPGTPIPGAWVDVWNNQYYDWAETDENGEFYLDLPAGEYDVWVGADEYFGIDAFIVINEGTHIVRNYSLDPQGQFAGGLEGYVYDNQTSDPIPGAEVAIGNENYGITIWTDSYGYFEVSLPEGFYWLDVWSPGYTTLYDTVSVDEGFVYRDFYLRPGMQNLGEISGTITDNNSGDPIEGAMVFVASTDFSYGNVAFTDMDGQFYMPAVPFGEYNLMVEAEGYFPGYRLKFYVDNQNIAPYFDIKLNVGEFASAFRGVVQNEAGGPIDMALVLAFDVDNEARFFATFTNPDGTYFLNVRNNGTYQLVADAPGFYRWFSEEIYSVVDDTFDINIVMEEGGTNAEPPQFAGIHDVPNDQGRQVRLNFHPGRQPDGGDFIGWSVWRELRMTGRDDLWEFVNYVPFHDMEMYSLVAATMIDSNKYTGPVQEYWTAFKVSGHTYDPYWFVDSEPMRGYSVDNLKPGIPGNLSGGLSENVVQLAWEASDAPDLQYYSVYRGTSANFAPSASNRIGQTTVVQFSDASVTEFPAYYKVTATDLNGNESSSAGAGFEITNLAAEAGIPDEFRLAQNYPNPFNPTTTIEYQLPADGIVSVGVYNILGQPVKVLADGFRQAGYFNTIWDGTDNAGNLVASGMYFYKIRVIADQKVQYQDIRKMVLMR